MLDKASVVKNVKVALLGDENVMLSYLFSSFAWDHLSPLSDVDVAMDTEFILSATKNPGEAISGKNDFHMVVTRSTVLLQV